MPTGIDFLMPIWIQKVRSLLVYAKINCLYHQIEHGSQILEYWECLYLMRITFSDNRHEVSCQARSITARRKTVVKGFLVYFVLLLYLCYSFICFNFNDEHHWDNNYCTGHDSNKGFSCIFSSSASSFFNSCICVNSNDEHRHLDNYSLPYGNLLTLGQRHQYFHHTFQYGFMSAWHIPKRKKTGGIQNKEWPIPPLSWSREILTSNTWIK